MSDQVKTAIPTGMLIDTKDIEAAGEALGVMCAAFMKGFAKGFEAIQELYKEQEAKNTTAGTEEEAKTPKRCLECWCNECAEFEDCIVEKEGYDPASKPCPCDGCKKGMRYMPKEKPPCEKFKPVGEPTDE